MATDRHHVFVSRLYCVAFKTEGRLPQNIIDHVLHRQIASLSNTVAFGVKLLLLGPLVVLMPDDLQWCKGQAFLTRRVVGIVQLAWPGHVARDGVEPRPTVVQAAPNATVERRGFVQCLSCLHDDFARAHYLAKAHAASVGPVIGHALLSLVDWGFH